MKNRLAALNSVAPGPLGDLGLLMMRVSAGLLISIAHGLPKALSWSERADSFADPIGVGPTASLALAVFAELVCGIAVALGLFTRLSAVPVVITLLVAAFIIHADDPFRKMEFALVYAIPFVTLIFTGPGRYSLDGWLAGHSRGR